MDLGPHAEFIWSAYAAAAVAIALLIFWLVMDGRRQARHLDELTRLGGGRRSAGVASHDEEQ